VTDHLQGLDTLTERLIACNDLDTLLSASLEGLSSIFGYDHSFLLVPDEEEARLFTVASRGFPVSGVGSEVAVGEGIIGVAAERRSPRKDQFTSQICVPDCAPAWNVVATNTRSSARSRCPAWRTPAASSPF